jgi:hypothetical protein
MNKSLEATLVLLSTVMRFFPINGILSVGLNEKARKLKN